MLLEPRREVVAGAPARRKCSQVTREVGRQRDVRDGLHGGTQGVERGELVRRRRCPSSRVARRRRRLRATSNEEQNTCRDAVGEGGEGGETRRETAELSGVAMHTVLTGAEHTPPRKTATRAQQCAGSAEARRERCNEIQKILSLKWPLKGPGGKNGKWEIGYGIL